MKKFLIIVILLAVGLGAAFYFVRASGDAKPFPDSTPIVRDIDSVWVELGALCLASVNLDMEQIGLVDYGRFKQPIMLIRYRPADPRAPRILINAVVHGNEPASLETVATMVRRLVEGKCRLAGMSVDLIPIVNPWGYAHDKRFNKDGRDINRDFASFNTQEANIMRDFLAGKTYNMMIDLHEDPWAKGCYLYQYGRDSQTLARKVLKSLRGEGAPIEPDRWKTLLKLDNGLLDAPMWGLWYMKLSRQLSLSNYYRLNNSQAVFTVETPVEAADIGCRTRWQLLALQGLIRGAFGGPGDMVR